MTQTSRELSLNKTLQFYETSTYYITNFINALKLKMKNQVQEFNCFHIIDQGTESWRQSLQNADRIPVFLLI